MALRRALTRLLAGTIALTSLGVSGCSTVKRTTPELSDYEGKRIALVEIDGEATARSVIEVALVNQLVQRGTFILIPKKELDQARVAAAQDPTDWKGIARRAGADYALRAKVVSFDAQTEEGYSSIEEEDSQLAEERGDDGKTQRLYKIRTLKGDVKVRLEFTGVSADVASETRSAIAEASSTVTAEAKSEAAHLPPRLRLLENLANEAFHKFFEIYR